MKPKKIAVVGAGIIGAAVARTVSYESPSGVVTVYEKEAAPSKHQTGRNSGVIHAGLYYPEGSLKARLTRRGVELLTEFCAVKDITVDHCGKLVIAQTPHQEALLGNLLTKAQANQVPGVRIIDQDAIREREPHAVGLAALHSPETSIIDYAQVTEALLRDVTASGGSVHFDTPVFRIQQYHNRQIVHSAHGSEEFDLVVVCSGLQSDRLARASGLSQYPLIVPFSGDYYQLTDEAAPLVNGLIYPVPDPEFPFLGVHLTKSIHGGVTVGPNAFLAFAREKYGRGSLSIPDLWQTARSGAFWRFARENYRVAWGQLRTANKRAFVAGAQSFIPQLTHHDLVPGKRGIRAQAMDRSGKLLDDFVIQRKDNAVFIRNAPSPAATSALAIAEYIVNEALTE